MRSLLSEVDACCLGGNYTEIVWQQTLLRHLRMTITTFQMLRNKIGPVSQVMPSHSAQSNMIFLMHVEEFICKMHFHLLLFALTLSQKPPQASVIIYLFSKCGVFNAISRPIRTYFTRWLWLIRTTSLVRFVRLSKPQWRVGLGAGLDVGNCTKFIRIGNS